LIVVVVVRCAVAYGSLASSPTSSIARSHALTAAATRVYASETDGDDEEEYDYGGEQDPTTPASPVVITAAVIAIAEAAVVAVDVTAAVAELADN